ncbi:MAG: hypothetical protein LQ351_005703 [Letrouitia transgressa]|nr:MAG: hypothetical protein LQ351_005703 [Letrouitia transgressa]
MSPSAQEPGPKPMPSGGVPLPPSPEKISAQIDLLITLHLSLWPALTLSVNNSLGGPLSSQKRDWFAGAVSSVLSSTSDSDLDVPYLEEFLLQVMNDEFEVNVDDESAEDVARWILEGRKRCLEGDFRAVEDVVRRWKESTGKKGGVGEVMWQEVEGEETKGYSEEDDESDGKKDVEMNEGPELVAPPKRKKVAPKVDEEGFTVVIGKKRR